MAPWNSNRIRRSKRSVMRELCFHPLGASEDSTLSRTKAVDHDQSSTHDNHCALLFGYTR